MNTRKPKSTEIVVEKIDAGQRLDAFLAKHFTHCSRRRAREACQAQQVFVGGRPQAPGYQLKVGDALSVAAEFLPVRARGEIISPSQLEEFANRVIYEDKYLLAVNKEREISSITLRTDDPPTVADYLAAYCPECRSGSRDMREAGLVQRLDYCTSGAVIASKSSDVWDKLHHLILSNGAAKTYFALVEGDAGKKEFSIAAPLVNKQKNKIRAALKTDKAKDIQEAYTLITPIRTFSSNKNNKAVSLVRAASHRTRRHQIRVHLAETGHPLCGDTLYGSKTSYFIYPEDPDEIKHKGFFLHAESISLSHPITGSPLEIRAPHPMVDKD